MPAFDPRLALPVLDRLERRGWVSAVVADRMARVIRAAPRSRGLVVETVLGGDGAAEHGPLPLDLAVRCAADELRALAPDAPTLHADADILAAAGADRFWLEHDTSRAEPGTPSLFAQFRHPPHRSVIGRLGWPAAAAHAAGHLSDATIRHLGLMYGRSPADARVVWDGLSLDRMAQVTAALGLAGDLRDALGGVARRREGFQLALAFGPDVLPRFGVEWPIRRAPDPPAQWAALGRSGRLTAPAREFGWWWFGLTREVAGLRSAAPSHVKWTFDGARTALRGYFALG